MPTQGYDRVSTGSPISPPPRPSSPKRYPKPPGVRSLPCISSRSTVLFFILGFLIVTTLPLAYVHRENPAISPAIAFLTGSSHPPPWIPTPSGGVPGLPFTLEARLTDLLARPALAQWEAELPSRHACPMYTYARNTYFFHDGDKPQQWEKIGPTEIRRYRQKMVEYLRSVEREGGKLVWEKGMDDVVPKESRRGLIYTGGEGVSGSRARYEVDVG